MHRCQQIYDPVIIDNGLVFSVNSDNRIRIKEMGELWRIIKDFIFIFSFLLFCFFYATTGWYFQSKETSVSSPLISPYFFSLLQPKSASTQQHMVPSPFFVFSNLLYASIELSVIVKKYQILKSFFFLFSSYFLPIFFIFFFLFFFLFSSYFSSFFLPF